ncbi:hypothetical protein R1sor_000317 [Riccia sorocarpa]|uniref:Integrase catalytic domain-containing protein n=1 Tax=Riccia sorocarpa TaxID=122646 RepID=A0ABD3GVX3_9MARC
MIPRDAWKELEAWEGKKLRVSTSLTESEEQMYCKFLQNYRDIFAFQMSDLKGILPEIGTHRIDIKPDAVPVRQLQYRLNQKYSLLVKENLDSLLDAGFIYPILSSDWVSPIVVVPKKATGKIRVCQDFQKLNEVTLKDHHPLPFTDVILDQVAGYEQYSFLDGFSGYNQVFLKPEDCEKTTFTTDWGTFAYKVMPFGLTNAPATFQRMMTNIFRDYLRKFIEVFLDDFCVFSNRADHLDKLEKTFQKCCDSRLCLHPEKSSIGMTEGILLEHRISAAGIEVDTEKVAIIVELQPPRCLRDVRAFLGSTGYYRRFIWKYAEVAGPLTNLLKKVVAWTWGAREQAAFESLKKRLVSAPVLIPPNWDKPFHVYVDTSAFAIGVILSQKDDSKLDHPIYFSGKKLSDAERKYTTTEREALGMLYRVSIDDVPKDSWYSDIWRFILLQEYPRLMGREEKMVFLRKVGPFEVHNDRLFKYGLDEVYRRCLERDEVEVVIRSLHGGLEGGHFGVQTTAKKVLAHGYWWPTVFRDVAAFIKKCDPCQRTGKPTPTSRWPLTPIMPLAPFERWGIDFVGPIAPATQGTQSRYILLATDYFTRMVEAEATKKDDVATVAQFLFDRIICRYGCPLELVSDRGTHFINKTIAEMSEQYEIRHRKTTPYNPKANGMMERSNGILSKILKKITQIFIYEWDRKLPSALLAYRTAQKTTTDCTPFFMCYGMDPILPIELDVPTFRVQIEERLNSEDSCESRQLALAKLEEERLRVKKEAGLLQAKRKLKYDKKLRKGYLDVRKGDLALLFDSRRQHFLGKLHLNWGGSYSVIEVFDNHIVQLADMTGELLPTRTNGWSVKRYFT